MSKSENRLKTRQLGLRLEPSIFGRLEAEAKVADCSPTSLARRIIAEKLGIEFTATNRCSPRRGKAPNMRREIQAGLQFLAELHDVRIAIESCVGTLRNHQHAGRLLTGSAQMGMHADFHRTIALLTRIEIALIRAGS